LIVKKNTDILKGVISMSNMVEKDNIISESGYSSLLETLYLLSDPTMKEKLEAAKNATDDDYKIFKW
jgi:hypothetical protein